MTAKLPRIPRTLSASETAEHLAQNLGGTTAHWATWLANERKPGRVNRKMPIRPGKGRPKYDVDVVEAFILDKKSNDEAQGVNRVIPKEREFNAHVSAVSASENDGVPFVLLVTVSPLASYKLTATQARQMAHRLNSAADSVDEAD